MTAIRIYVNFLTVFSNPYIQKKIFFFLVAIWLSLGLGHIKTKPEHPILKNYEWAY